MRKIIGCFLIVIIAISVFEIGSSFSYADEYKSANLILRGDRSLQTFELGEEVRLVIPIQNLGDLSAEDVIVSIDTSDLENFPFEMEDMAITKRRSSIDGHNSEDIGFYLKVAKSAKEKMYPIKVNIKYNGGSLSETIYIKIEENKQKPTLKLVNVKYREESVYAGNTSTMILELRNAGETKVNNVELSFEGLSADGIRLDDYIEIPTIQEIEKQHFKEIPVKIHVDENLESGTYEIELLMKYKDEYLHQYEEKKKIYIPVEGTEDQTLDFEFEDLQYPKDGVQTSEDFNISFNLRNLSEQEAKNITVRVDAGEDILPKSASIKNIKILGEGQSVPVEFTLFAKDGIEEKNYPVKIELSYELKGSKENENHSYTQYVGIFVQGDDSKLTPKIIVGDYKYGKEYIKTGEIFPLTISFFNTNKNMAVKNIKVSLTSEEETFSPVGSSNSFFIEEIPPSGRVERTVKLKAKADADQKMYNVNIDMDYEDGKGNKYMAKEIIGINVIQEVRFETSDVKLPDECIVGETSGLSIDFYNLGRGTLRNMMINTKGEFEVKDGAFYIGNVEAGKDDYYDVSIVPNKEGKATGEIIFTFEDAVGNPYEIIRKFEISATELSMPPVPMEGMEQEGIEEKNFSKWIFIAVGVFIVIGGWIFYKKRKKKAEEVAFDE